MADLGGLIVHLCVDACISLYEVGNGRETWVHQVTKGFTVLETVITK